MESTVSIEQFREELQSWKHELSAFKQEIRQFESKLEDMAAKNLPKNLLAEVEHFQNSFICQKEVIDKLRHDLPDSRHKVENIFRTLYPVTVSNKSGDVLCDRMDMFRRIYEEVKDDFKRFESDWM
jgi:hypothetical protein